MSARVAATAALAGVPVATLLAAYAWLAHDHATPWVFPVVVHESGRYTLTETILYWRHFLRELPVAAIYAAASLAAASAYGPRPTAAPSGVVRGIALAGAVLLAAGAWALAAREWGSAVAWGELGQAYRHDGDAPVPGVHWGYHALSTLAYVAAAVGLAGLLQRLLDGARRAPDAATRTRSIGAVVAAVAALAIVCGTGAEPFLDARYLGHQAREVATHLLVTLPLSFAVLAVAGGWGAGAGTRPDGGAGRDVARATAAAAVTIAYLALGVLATDARFAAAAAPLSGLVAAHCYEHALDYVLVALLVLALAPGGRGRANAADRLHARRWRAATSAQ